MVEHTAVGCSPDADDLFMAYGLLAGHIPTPGLALDFVERDIETLNSWACEGKLPVTALSAHAFAYTGGQYCVLSHGASMGERYGPIVVTREPCGLDELRAMRRIAVPGELTSAFLMLRLAIGKFSYYLAPYDTILDEVANGQADAGLIIHEGQLTFGRQSLCVCSDLGRWWHEQSGGLPFPLSVTAIRRDIEPAVAVAVSRLLKQSICYSLEHRQEALAYVLHRAPHLDATTTDAYIRRYVNGRTVAMGPDGRRAITEFLSRGYEQGLLPHATNVHFLDDSA
jgi:1,4-dihydroxy-6-naphthoate synthase